MGVVVISAVEGGRERSDLAHGQFLKQQIIPDFVEGGEWTGRLEQSNHVAVLLVQAEQNIEHQRAITNDLSQIAE